MALPQGRVYNTDLLKIKKFAAAGWGVSPENVAVRQLADHPDHVQVAVFTGGDHEVYLITILAGKVLDDTEVVAHLEGFLHLPEESCPRCEAG